MYKNKQSLPLRGKKLLLVEDNVALTNVLKDKLTHENFYTLIAKNGEEGLKIAIKEQPDIILLDVLMPKMNGLIMLKKLREDTWGKTVPVIILSNDDNPEHISETLKDNALDYLIKVDWKLDDIVKKIKETLRL